MIHFSNKTENKQNPTELQYAQLQSQIDEISSRLGSLDSSTDSRFVEIVNDFSAITQSFSDVIQSLQSTGESVEELKQSLQTLISELSAEIDSEKIVAEIATLKKIISENIVAQTVNTDSVVSNFVKSEEVKTKKMSAKEIEVETLKQKHIESDSVETEILEAQDISSRTSTSEISTTSLFDSDKIYHSTGYEDNNNVERYRFNAQNPFILVSTDPEDKWIVMWNGGISFYNPKLTLYSVDIVDKNKFVQLDFLHPQKELQFKIFSFSELTENFTFELVELTEADERTVEYYGVFPALGGESGLQLFVVEELPEVLLKKSLYVVENENETETFYVTEEGEAKPLVTTIGDLHIRESLKIDSEVITWNKKEYSVWLNGENPTEENLDWVRR